MTSVAIIGAGIGGLTAAALLAAAGHAVTLCEAAEHPGGKLRELAVGGARIDAGPTVFTLRPVFEGIFAAAGARLAEHVALQRLDCLARHFWEGGGALDLTSDVDRNAAAIAAFAGREAARGYAKFAAKSAKIFDLLDASFMQIPQPGLAGLIRRGGPGLAAISPFASLWGELGKFFPDPRLRQLFARYATYCGSSPFSAPATLMLVAEAERRGVWRVEGGMARLAEALQRLAAGHGAAVRAGAKVVEILTQDGRAAGLRLADGTAIPAQAVICNAELAALEAGLFGRAAQDAVAGLNKGATPSLSALTWVATGASQGAALAHHSVFFSKNYPSEFAAIAAGKPLDDPTVYVCAPAEGAYFLLVNAAAGTAPAAAEKAQALQAVQRKLSACGVTLRLQESLCTGPAEFGARFPASGGALYGRALEGWRDSFARPGARTRLPGLYLAGGSVHPGPGLPMAATSGRIAADCILQDQR